MFKTQTKGIPISTISKSLRAYKPSKKILEAYNYINVEKITFLQRKIVYIELKVALTMSGCRPDDLNYFKMYQPTHEVGLILVDYFTHYLSA